MGESRGIIVNSSIFCAEGQVRAGTIDGRVCKRIANICIVRHKKRVSVLRKKKKQENRKSEKRKKEMKLQRLLSLTRKAIDEFSMIEEGDRIAVGILQEEETSLDTALRAWRTEKILPKTIYGGRRRLRSVSDMKTLI